MVLYHCAQPWPVLSGGLSVPPARIEPVTFLTSTLSKQDGCSGSVFPPVLWQVPSAGLVLSRSAPTTIWSIWPTFSSNVIRPSRSSTRDEIEAPGSRYSVPALRGTPAADGPPTSSATRHTTAAGVLRTVILRDPSNGRYIVIIRSRWMNAA